MARNHVYELWRTVWLVTRTLASDTKADALYELKLLEINQGMTSG